MRSTSFSLPHSSELPPLFHAKDPVSALTHFIACVLAVVGMPFLLIQTSLFRPDRLSLLSVSVFMLSMVFLYGASTAYHTFLLTEKGRMTLKKLDHAMIYLLIAGSYTPICVMALAERGGFRLMAVVWAVALVGILFTLLWVTCPRWVSSLIYIGMGWLCVTAFSDILATLPPACFLWLLIGGLAYTAGGVIYAVKFSISKTFGAHELFHIFVMIGSVCHYICMFMLISAI